jgi:hypothetical protein
MPAGVGADSSVRRWRVSLTLVGWMLLIQAAFGTAAAPLAWVGMRLTGPAGYAGFSSLAPVPGGSEAALAQAFSSIGIITWFSLAFNLVLLAGSIGLLKRWRWGWFMVIGAHIAAIAGSFIWGLPMLRAVLSVFAPADAGLAALAITGLLALVPASIIGFLMTNGIVRQFAADSAGPVVPTGSGEDSAS